MSGQPPPPPPKVGTRPRILVVDDEQAVCTVMASVLEGLGYETVTLVDPQAALERIESSEYVPDVLITDFAMPHLSGLELIKRSKSLHPSLKTILSSGEVDRPGNAGSTEPDAYLEKPFSTNTLASVLRSLIGPGSDTAGLR